MPPQTPWWITSASSLGISVVVFALGYFLLYRPQLRHISAQLEDRNAALDASQGAQALDFAKAILAWYPVATARYESPGAAHRPIPSAEVVDDASRLANDPLLRALLVRAAELLAALNTYPGTWWNEALKINRTPEAVDRLGPVGMVENLTPEQIEYLVPMRVKWEARRDAWGVAAKELAEVSQAMRERAEMLLRAVAP